MAADVCTVSGTIDVPTASFGGTRDAVLHFLKRILPRSHSLAVKKMKNGADLEQVTCRTTFGAYWSQRRRGLRRQKDSALPQVACFFVIEDTSLRTSAAYKLNDTPSTGEFSLPETISKAKRERVEIICTH
jgi:hypothetical protein